MDGDVLYYSGSLTLPDGFIGGRVVRASGGGGSGETFVTVCAERGGEVVYLDYFINYNNDPFLPDFVYVLDDQQVTELRDAMNNTPIHRDIYLCDDVYRSTDTPTHGRAEVFIPIALTDYTVTDCQILRCEDGCDPTDVVSRAFWGYGPAWRIDRYEEYKAADGWRFDTRRYINEVPEEIRVQMRAQGAPDSVIYPREYLYLVTLEPGLYAFIVIEPYEPDGAKPTDEIGQVNGFIRNMEAVIEIQLSEEELSEEIVMPVEKVVEEVVEEPNPDWLVDENSEPYTYTYDEWIKYSLYTDFGFRDPVDVTALTDNELTTYMADAYQCALDIYFLFEVNSDRMYARTYWSSTMPHVEIDGRYYSQMFNPVFPTIAELESYMNGVLSHDLTKKLLSLGMFIDYEGELYGMMGARGTNISMKTIGFSVTSRTDTQIIYTAEVEVREADLSAEEPDYVEYYDFTYALTEDGWRWTDFYLYN